MSNENDYGVKPEWREAFITAGNFCNSTYLTDLRDLSVHLLAALMKSEFRREHQISYQGRCVACMILSSGRVNPHHNYTHDDWLAAAKKELER